MGGGGGGGGGKKKKNPFHHPDCVVLIGSSLNVLKHFKSCIGSGDGTFSTLKLFYCRFVFVFHGFHVKSNILKPFLHENYFLKGIKTTVCVENLIER